MGFRIAKLNLSAYVQDENRRISKISLKATVSDNHIDLRGSSNAPRHI